ncbi:nicotinate-nucleotide adenylyltransferase [Alishewanella sp. SMS8]|uniref:nicotinate-nucleotide adenylyltransferase n=1 Tax=unclassified Alishewanella TaxID=2628974 RepID=UPI00274044FD|nr:nicotinate-nucleotide adenylyltransferase [Alishewanella sp. SMS8]MDP5035332.1 nicotinate-nucleotide adenylyltransferase [Alishewanella sp.]MDP5186306.1 nicotinate-nucleotide adenylyltransferase [Alishewanella sp.]MDP5459342.1 nicotinate-nucleotide adenylyltransferase [Alishewanella sp. SMS8]
MMTKPLLGIFGGTFDPIHRGHLACARYVVEHCALKQLALMPCHLPPHRATPGVSSEQRAAMVKLAIANEPTMRLERLELNRTSPSYTVDSLRTLKQQQPDTTLAFIIGMDSLQYFTKWHQWLQILELAHLIVCRRPGYSADQGDAPMLLARYGATLSQLQQQDAGKILLLDNPDFYESATFVRQQLASDRLVQAMLPAEVLEYIRQHALYGC